MGGSRRSLPALANYPNEVTQAEKNIVTSYAGALSQTASKAIPVWPRAILMTAASHV